MAGAASLLLGSAGGGLRGLGEALAQAGCATHFDSWVAVGPNLAISAADVRRALEPSVQAIAATSCRDPERVAAGLASLLPRLVDALTPAGRLPPAGRLGTLWALARLLWRGRRGNR
jgi:uncharacterized protein YidB (DUF937 family)